MFLEDFVCVLFWLMSSRLVPEHSHASSGCIVFLSLPLLSCSIHSFNPHFPLFPSLPITALHSYSPFSHSIPERFPIITWAVAAASRAAHDCIYGQFDDPRSFIKHFSPFHFPFFLFFSRLSPLFLMTDTFSLCCCLTTTIVNLGRFAYGDHHF